MEMARAVKKEGPTDEEILQAFRGCEFLDEEEATRKAPEIMAVAVPLAKSLSLSWPSKPQICLAARSTGAFCNCMKDHLYMCRGLSWWQ